MAASARWPACRAPGAALAHGAGSAKSTAIDAHQELADAPGTACDGPLGTSVAANMSTMPTTHSISSHGHDSTADGLSPAAGARRSGLVHC